MLASVPWSPDSDVFRVTVTGMIAAFDSARDSVAVTVTDWPSVTGFGEAESVTVGGRNAVRLRETVSPADQDKPELAHCVCPPEIVAAETAKFMPSTFNVAARKLLGKLVIPPSVKTRVPLLTRRLETL